MIIEKIFKPNFTDKTLKDKMITLVDEDEFVTQGKNVVKKLKEHFEEIVETLKIARPILSDLSYDPVLNVIEKFSNMLVSLKSSKPETLSKKYSYLGVILVRIFPHLD